MNPLLESFKVHSGNLVHSVSFDFLPLLPKVLAVGLAIVTVVLLYQMVRTWFAKRRRSHPTDLAAVPENVAVESRSLLTKEEATLYNLVHLAVRDGYLLLAKLPLRYLVKVRTEDDGARRALLRAIQKIHVDFVLVHPGTLVSAKVVLIEENEGTDQPMSQNRLVDTVLREAEIEVVRLQANTNYTVPQLAGLLGLATED